MRRVWIAGLALAVALPAMAGPAPEAAKTFGGWTAACNNIGACVVIGSTQDERLAYLRFARDAGATAAPALAIVVTAPEAIKGDVAAFRLTAHDAGHATPLGPFAATPDGTDRETYVANVAAGEPTLAVLEAIRNAATLDYRIGDAKGTLDLKGLSAALRYIDARQGRAGTPTALVARGMTPIGQVPPPGVPPVVTAAPAGSAHEIAKPVVTPLLLAAAAPPCDADVLEAHDGTQAWDLGAGRVMFALACSSGAYNVASVLLLTDAKGDAPRPLDLPRPPGETPDQAANVVVNMDFDPKTMTLSAFDKGRGIGDCGATTTWLWTGTAFALLDAELLDACPGARAEDWPNVYTAKRKE